MKKWTLRNRRTPLAVAAVLGLAVAASPALAQDDYGPAPYDYGRAPYYGGGSYSEGAPPDEGYAPFAPDDSYYGPPPGGPNETVIVNVPRLHYTPRVGELGGPIERVSLSEPVRFDDLDLRSDWGVHELYDRIRFTAREECRRLDAMYPIAADDNPPCYRSAVEDAMEQADAAIADARR